MVLFSGIRGSILHRPIHAESPKKFQYDMDDRSLSFSELQQVMPEVYRLLDQGYTQMGSWDLTQTCEHLADWMSFPFDGFPKPPWFIAWMFPIKRLTVGKSSLKRIPATGAKCGQGLRNVGRRWGNDAEVSRRAV